MSNDNITTNNLIEISRNEELLVRYMQLLGDKTRYKMFKLMLSDDDLCVSQMSDRLGVSTSAVSQHFKIFEILGVVHKDRRGQKICYLVNKDDTLVGDLIKFIGLHDK